MAAKSPKYSSGGDWKGFINYDLSVQQKQEIKQTLVGTGNELQYLEELTQHGYKVSISEDSRNDCYIVTATGKSKGCANRGYSLSQRHSSVAVAIICVWFVLSELGEWEDISEIGRANEFDW